MALSGVVATALGEFVDSVVAALPRVIAGVVFLALAAVSIKLVMVVVRFGLRRTVPGESPVYRQFLATIVRVFLWFGAGLAFLATVGLDRIAASLGTATGFPALGISYALSGMIADAVSGVYLLRDPDFMPGDRVEVDDTVGEVLSIELRKTRLDVDGNTKVLANEEIEGEWTKLDDDGTAAPASEATE